MLMTDLPLDGSNIHQLRDFLLNQRRIANWTQEELAERSGVSVRTIRNLETGANTNPRRSSVALLLKALGTATASLSEAAPWGGGDWPQPAEQRPAPHRPKTSALPPWHGPRPPHDPLVGRQADMRHVLAATQHSRLTVLTGPGGVGKTRLALAAAALLRPLFLGGVYVAELDGCPPEHRDPAGARAELTRAVEELIGEGALSRGDLPAGRRLLVLDGTEHITQQTMRIAQRLLDEHPGLHLLITSRRILTGSAAKTWEVEPLPADHGGADDGGVPSAVELFLRRVEASLPTLDLRGHLPLVGQLCRLLDGLPLAIEIAARRLRALPLSSLLQGETLFPLLGTTDASDLSRHGTLSGNLRWSYDLLSPPHRELLHALAVLPDTFSLDEALAARPGGWPTSQVAQLLAELAEASLVQIKREQQYTYHIHALVRHFVVRLERPAGSAPVRIPEPEQGCLA
ncbi:helix-turn-helix domain-containing protein [Streptomyces hiroshimensis]|uniref:HTH cro/C1-type domain-containing protein n=1 Tax=Streptomyces hiroshimensis TaxID=66424 RepID=A0ABQ2Y451_9ACTN|nr:helix-turn-helix domain-containing protein [Streptomyces hiroshimensis]GGX62027.1 hypothetical protein GCM10010324_03430 [Streptomyces hiroshimensis]